MCKRGKKTAKTKTQFAMPQFISKPQNSKNRILDTGPCHPETGRVRRWMLCRRKDNCKRQN
ncbi:hypothetical protein Hanom_Chr13g01191191 [Helianthus anomalus]